jgi:uncharacterized protein with HEPN domain
MMQFATIKQIEIIGEAANHMSEEKKNNHTHILCRQFIGLRNFNYVNILRLTWHFCGK